MLMPKKHINLSESLIGIGGIILQSLGKRIMSLDEIISDTDQTINNNKDKKIYNNIDNILLTIDYLYSIGIIDINDEGGIYNVFNRT